jgi:hypothetical protein
MEPFGILQCSFGDGSEVATIAAHLELIQLIRAIRFGILPPAGPFSMLDMRKGSVMQSPDPMTNRSLELRLSQSMKTNVSAESEPVGVFDVGLHQSIESDVGMLEIGSRERLSKHANSRDQAYLGLLLLCPVFSLQDSLPQCLSSAPLHRDSCRRRVAYRSH